MAKKRRPKQQQQRKEAPAQEGPALSPEEKAARREQQKREWAEQRRKVERVESSGSPVLWGVVGVAAVIGVIVLGVVLLSGGGGGGGSSSPTPANTPDARVAGLPITTTLDITASDQGQEVNVNYDKTTLTGKAGDVIQINVKNTGTVAHNLEIAGLDGQFDTLDDWVTDPFAVPAGQTGKVIVKLDKAGTYQFHCTFHPSAQQGVLVIS